MAFLIACIDGLKGFLHREDYDFRCVTAGRGVRSASSPLSLQLPPTLALALPRLLSLPPSLPPSLSLTLSPRLPRSAQGAEAKHPSAYLFLGFRDRNLEDEFMEDLVRTWKPRIILGYLVTMALYLAGHFMNAMLVSPLSETQSISL